MAAHIKKPSAKPSGLQRALSHVTTFVHRHLAMPASVTSSKVLSANGDKPWLPTLTLTPRHIRPHLLYQYAAPDGQWVYFRNRLKSYLRNAFLQAAFQRVSTAALSDKGSSLLLFVTAFVCVLSYINGGTFVKSKW